MSEYKGNDRIGERRQMKNGLWATIIDYKISRKITIRFDNGVIKKGSYTDFRDGTLTDLIIPTFVKNDNKIGLVNKQKCGEACKIIKANNWEDITVQFLETGTIKHATFNAFKIGAISNKEKKFYSIGETFTNRFGINYRIISMNKLKRRYLVEFEDGVQKDIHHSQVEDAFHPDFYKNGNMHDFHNYSGKCIRINNTYWFKTDLGLITAREILDAIKGSETSETCLTPIKSQENAKNAGKGCLCA